MRHIYLVFAVMLLAANTACAASFDCAKAGTKVEKMICTNAGLSKLDDELGKVYSEALAKFPDYSSNYHHLQMSWLKERNKCNTTDCLRNAYQQRIAQLSPSKTNGQAETISVGPEGGSQCLKPKIDWRNYAWTLITGRGMSACEGMLAYLKSRPVDMPPPVCPEDRLPPTKDWERPKTRILGKEEMQRLIRDVPEAMHGTYTGDIFKLAKMMEMIQADITRDGIPETLLAYSKYDYRKECRRSTQCADTNEVFPGAYKYQIRLTSASFDLLPMNEEGTQVDWLHKTVRSNPMLMNGNLIYYKRLPYWMSEINWGQASQDDFEHSRMRPDNPYSAIFSLAEIGVATGNLSNKRPPFNEVIHVTYEHDPKSNNVCRFGYFRRENLKQHPPAKRN